jgi:hypothetical protein
MSELIATVEEAKLYNDWYMTRLIELEKINDAKTLATARSEN